MYHHNRVSDAVGSGPFALWASLTLFALYLELSPVSLAHSKALVQWSLQEGPLKKAPLPSPPPPQLVLLDNIFLSIFQLGMV